MRFSVLLISILLLSGCAPGRFSMHEGSAKFSIPFDFPSPQKQSLQEKKMLEEMERLQGQIAPEEDQLQASED